jgi:hypothetical protein
VAHERAASAMPQENEMQPRSIQGQSIHGKYTHGAAPGFRVLDQDAATAVVRRHPPLPFASLAGGWDEIVRRADRTIDVDLYRRRIAARSRRAARESAALTSACVGALAMAAIYLTLFFAAAYTRGSNDLHPPMPVVAVPTAPDVIF